MGSQDIRRIKLYRGMWCVVWRENGKTRRQSLHTSDKPEADRRFQEYLAKLGKLKSGTIAQIIANWLADKQHLKTIKIAEQKTKPLLAFWGEYRPEHISRALCREYRRKRGNVSNTTIRNELAILRSAVNWNDPHNTAVFEFPPLDAPRDHYLTQAEYNRLYLAAGSFHIKLFIVLALHTAARSNALLELLWSQVDMDKRVINLSKGNHKNKRRAIVPINDVLFEALTQACMVRTCDYVIERGGKKVGSVKKGFANAAAKAEVQASPHVLRHTAAVILAEGGCTVQEVQQYLGHAGKTTTERIYALHSPDYLRKAGKVLSDWHIEACGGILFPKVQIVHAA